MEINIKEIAADGAYFRRIVRKYGKSVRELGWEGPLEPSGLEQPGNWDAFYEFLADAVKDYGEEVFFYEGEDEGIPGCGDIASVIRFEGKYYVLGSSVGGGPFDTRAEAKGLAS